MTPEARTVAMATDATLHKRWLDFLLREDNEEYQRLTALVKPLQEEHKRDEKKNENYEAGTIKLALISQKLYDNSFAASMKQPTAEEIV